MNTRLKLTSIALAALLAFSGCTSMTGQTAGQNIDDATITASVKSKLVAEKTANLTRIDVDTTNQVVTLTGIVASERIRRLERSISPARSRESKV